MKELIKQPNGKYCSVDFKGAILFDNFSEQDVINMYIEQAKQDMENAEHFTEVIKRLSRADRHNSSLIDEFRLQAMGFDKPYKELIKYIPREPLNQHYVGHDCTTYGICPNCNKGVQDGMGFKEEKCSHCGQLLKW